MDLISIAKFVLLLDDDLNLAALLKSPIIGMSERQLYELPVNKNDNSLWENIKSYEEIYNKLNYLIELYKISTAENFFDLVINNLTCSLYSNRNVSPDTSGFIRRYIHIIDVTEKQLK